MNKIISFFTIATMQVIGWFIVKGALWLEFTFKYYTPAGKIGITIGHHMVICFVMLIAGLSVSEDITRKRK